MTPYAPPLTDMRFTLNDVVRLEDLTRLPGFEAVEASLSDQILEEAGKFSSNVLAPLNFEGDRNGAKIENGIVRPASGFGEAYKRWADAGWNSVPFDDPLGSVLLL